MAKFYTTLVLCALLSACGSQNPDQDDPQAVLPLTVPRTQVESDLGLMPGYTPTEAADAARGFIHYRIAYNYTQTPVWSPSLYTELLGGRLSFNCGEQSAAYRSILQAIGIESRFVWLRGVVPEGHPKAGQDFYHQTTEVFTDGKWWVSDPTFNVYFECNGKRPDAVEIRACNPVPFDGGVPPNPTLYSIQYPLSYFTYYEGISYTWPAVYR